MFYTYDGEGNRMRKCSASPCITGSTGTMYWRSTGGETLDESDLSGNATEEYIFFNGQRVARRDISTNVLHYYFSDYVNSSGVVENAAGTACEQDIDYYPYGGVENDYCPTPVPQNYKFTGKERDNESGLDDFDARYYASTMGRFMTPDWDIKPVTVPYAKFGDPQTLNLYGYVENSPVDRMDPTGHVTPPGQEASFACDGSPGCVAQGTEDEERNKWSLSWQVNASIDFLGGELQGVADATVTPLINAAEHPVDTVEGIANAVEHPVATAKSVVNGAVDTVKAAANGDPRAFGKVVATVATVAYAAKNIEIGTYKNTGGGGINLVDTPTTNSRIGLDYHAFKGSNGPQLHLDITIKKPAAPFGPGASGPGSNLINIKHWTP